MARTVVVPVDYSPAAQQVLVGAAALAGDKADRLIVVHVLPGRVPSVDPSNVWEKPLAAQRAAEQRLSEWINATMPGLQVAERLVDWGDAALCIVRLAKAKAADLIVIGAHGATPITGQVLGAVAREVVTCAPCAVWVVHTAAMESPPLASPNPTTVGSIVQRPPVTISQHATLATAEALMEREGIHQLPVVEHDVLIGIVSRRDLQAHIGYLENTKVDAAMTRGPIALQVGDSTDVAARVMLERNFNALPVLDGNRLVGVVSKTDLIRLLIALLDERAHA